MQYSAATPSTVQRWNEELIRVKLSTVCAFFVATVSYYLDSQHLLGNVDQYGMLPIYETFRTLFSLCTVQNVRAS